MATDAVRNVVLVHGGFVDGSGWEGVYRILKNDGYRVSVVQNPTITLADDVAVTNPSLTRTRTSFTCKPSFSPSATSCAR